MCPLHLRALPGLNLLSYKCVLLSVFLSVLACYTLFILLFSTSLSSCVLRYIRNLGQSENKNILAGKMIPFTYINMTDMLVLSFFPFKSCFMFYFLVLLLLHLFLVFYSISCFIWLLLFFYVCISSNNLKAFIYPKMLPFG